MAGCLHSHRTTILMQGGRRTGKTFSTFQLLNALGVLASRLKILVVCGSYPQLQATMEDFTDCIGVAINGNIVNGYSAHTNADTLWQFRNFDTKEKAQGTKCDIMFVNEAVNVDEEVFNTLKVGVRWFSILNYNPTKKCYVQRLVDADGGNLLTTTCHDNPHLTAEQMKEFESIKERAQRPTATNFDRYMYEVYYLGNFSSVSGSVFREIGRMTKSEYDQIPAHEVLGMDFGFATDGDPTTLVGCKVYQRHIYLHQYIYERGLTSDMELANRLVALGFNKYTEIKADYGGMGKGRIHNLFTAENGTWTGDIAGGFSVTNAVKTTIMDGISQMLSLDGITITDESEFMREEFEQYTFDEGGKPHGSDHAIDASRYAFTWARRCYND